MGYEVNDFRKLTVYKKCLDFYKNIDIENNDYRSDEVKIKKAISKIAGYIAKSAGDCLYSNSSINDIQQAININFKLDKLLKQSYLNNKEQLLVKLIEIRKMLFGLKKRIGEITK